MSASRSDRLSGVVWLSRSSSPMIRLRISGSASSRLTCVSRSRFRRSSSSWWIAALQLLVVRDPRMSAVERRSRHESDTVMTWTPVTALRRPANRPKQTAGALASRRFSTPASECANFSNELASSLWFSSVTRPALVQGLQRQPVVARETCDATGPPTAVSTSSWPISARRSDAADHHADLLLAVALPQRRGHPAGAAHRRQFLVDDHDDSRWPRRARRAPPRPTRGTSSTT